MSEAKMFVGGRKRCSGCQKYLPPSEFYPVKGGAYLSSRCKACTQVSLKRVATPEYRRGMRRKETQARSELIHDAKDRPCADCGIEYPPYVMDFDHRDPSQKVAKVSSISSLGKLRVEIAKCDVVCSNCHRQRTMRRGDHLPALLTTS